MTASLGGLMTQGYGIDAIEVHVKRQGRLNVERSEYKTALEQSMLATVLGLVRGPL